LEDKFKVSAYQLIKRNSWFIYIDIEIISPNFYTMNENSDSGTPKTTSNGLSSDKKTDKVSNVRSKNALMKLKSYVVALRVWSLSASMLPTILGKLI
jgi:hypothetical protein